MRRAIAILAALLLCTDAGAKSVTRQQDAKKSWAEPEIRAALCDIDKRDYASAQKRLERVLESDPENVYAEQILLGGLARQIKPGDKSPENLALIRKAIEAYQHALNNPQFSAEARARTDRYLLLLYGMISEEEQRAQLVKRASDSNRTPKERAAAYVVLASKAWQCSYEITSAGSAPEKSSIENARQCVAKGLDYVNQSISLDGENESAWSYKANLLREASRLAEMAGNQTQKDSYQIEADRAQKREGELLAKQEAERRKEDAKQEEESKFTTKQAEEMSKELTEYKAENSLAEAVREIFDSLELTSLVAPVPVEPVSEGSSSSGKEREPGASPQKGCFREAGGTSQVLEKREWKNFSPASEDIKAELPDNVCTSGNSYIAASDGVMYTIASMARPPLSLGPIAMDGLLNTLARTFLGFRSRTWLEQPGNSFEAKLRTKEAGNNQPGKVYTYALISCATRKDGLLIVRASKAHYYTIDISGAKETDPRAERFLKSLELR